LDFRSKALRWRLGGDSSLPCRAYHLVAPDSRCAAAESPWVVLRGPARQALGGARAPCFTPRASVGGTGALAAQSACCSRLPLSPCDSVVAEILRDAAGTNSLYRLACRARQTSLVCARVLRLLGRAKVCSSEYAFNHEISDDSALEELGVATRKCPSGRRTPRKTTRARGARTAALRTV